ncbi:MAG: DNA polymerase III subunit alpha [Deltaproteobacteria bacterium]|nr:DNA polymerase III subunit alpha [Deltaproteobacteria bacterium]
MSFVHLHLHTLYSLLDGAIRMKDLIKTVTAFKMPAVAVTDHGNMFGTIDFYKKAKDAGIKPIIGMEAYVAVKGHTDKTERSSHHLVLLAQNAEGYANLRTLASVAYMKGYYYNPRIDKELLAKHSKGVFASTACLGGEVPQNALMGNMDKARAAALQYREIFEPDHFFLEIQSNGMADQTKANNALKQLSRDTGIGLLATADCHYVAREQARAQEILMAIASGKTLADEKRLRHETAELYIKSPEEMAAAFSDVPEAVANTLRIAEQCHLELKLGASRPPSFPLPEGASEDDLMAELARKGLQRRFEEKRKKGESFDPDQYRARLELEVGVILKMGFAGYFLIVQDFINWGKEHGVPVGPGRGSGAGSIVAWSLRITDLDPIPYKLLFERFLNPERVSMPDFDVDFCQTNRFKVIDYVSDKYGKDKVGQIITFGSLKAKSVLRDVCRVMNLPFAEGDKIAKLVPDILGISLKDAIFGKKAVKEGEKDIAGEPKLKELIDQPKPLGVRMVSPGEKEEKEISTKDLLEIAMALEGLHRQPGMHAAGIVIGDRPLTEYVPLYSPPGEDIVVTQFAKDEVELAGLVKFDFLGLKTLTVIQHAIDLVNKKLPPEQSLEASMLPLNDDLCFELMAKGDTAGIFQMESSGFTEMVKALKPSCFEDIIAAGALYRPGPLKQKLPGTDTTMVELYIERKHGRLPVTYAHPKLEPLLKETYGVIVYQEQVMQISQVLAGYSLGRADLLRRAMGKKKKEVMEKERAGFMEGCLKLGVDEKVAGEVFDGMEKFAEYGFNKSHSAAYAVITMQTAWLKAHYRVEFMAALLSSEKDNTDKVVHHIAEARNSGLEVLQPDVNESEFDFSAVEGKIRFGLGAIKGVGEAAIDAIMAARKDGRFKGLFDFCQRVDLKRVNRKVIECLIKAGAFDFAKIARQRLFDSIDRALERGQADQRDKAVGQSSLFGALSAKGGKPVDGEDYVKGDEWPEKERLRLEKEAIGFYITGHPLEQYRKEIERYARPCSRVQQMRKDEKVTLAGIIVSLREKVTQSGKKMGWATLEDLSGSVELVLFPPKDGSKPMMMDGKWQKGTPRAGFENWEPLLKGDEPVLDKGAVQINNRDEENPKAEIIADSVESLAEVRAQRTKRLEIRVPVELATEERLVQLREACEKHPGKVGVAMQLLLERTSEITLCAAALKVAPSDELIFAIDKIFGSKVAELS